MPEDYDKLDLIQQPQIQKSELIKQKLWSQECDPEEDAYLDLLLDLPLMQL